MELLRDGVVSFHCGSGVVIEGRWRWGWGLGEVTGDSGSAESW